MNSFWKVSKTSKHNLVHNPDKRKGGEEKGGYHNEKQVGQPMTMVVGSKFLGLGIWYPSPTPQHTGYPKSQEQHIGITKSPTWSSLKQLLNGTILTLQLLK